MTHPIVILLVSLVWDACAATHDIHKFMTVEELKSTFHVDKHSLVPEYDIVDVGHRHFDTGRRKLSDNEIFGGSTIHDTIHGNKNKTDGNRQQQKEDPQQYSSSNRFKVKELDARTFLKLKAFGRRLNLNLVPNRGLYNANKLKIWTVKPNATAQHGVEYVMEGAENDEDIGEIYQDEENEAAILLRSHNDGVIVEGSIGSDLVIRPIPLRLQPPRNPKSTTEVYNDDEMFLDTDGELNSEVSIDTGLPIKRENSTSSTNRSLNSSTNQTPNSSTSKKSIKTSPHKHIVYKRNRATIDDSNSDYAFMEPDALLNVRRRRKKRSTDEGDDLKRNRRDAPYTIYPEILVIVDYDGYRLHGGDNLQIKRYFVSFWNGVDLRYKLLKGPKIRISIAGIIISRGRDATPYLERNRVGRDAIDSAAALTDMGKYLFRERRLPVYDIAVAITKYDMCRRRKGGRCTKGTAGFAYVGGACVVNKRLEKVNSVAIIEDTGGFSGIIVAAHEVGHLLGAVHDGSPPPSYLGGPGAEKCQWADGYIMSDLRHTERGFRWSSCSISSFHHFLNGDTATCLYNIPHEDENLPRVLPGKLLTLDAQCRRDRGTSACFKDDRVCAQLFCFDAGSGYCVAYRPAAEGSPCGDGQYCLSGRCVSEHENIIPDYSQNTPSYIQGNGVNQGRPLFYDEEENEDEDVVVVNKYQQFQRPQVQNYYYEYTTQSPPQQQHQQQTQPPQQQFDYESYYKNYYQNEYYQPAETEAPPTTTTPTTTTTTTESNQIAIYSTHYKPFFPHFTTTRSPYNFDNFGQYYYQTTPNNNANYYHQQQQQGISSTEPPFDYVNYSQYLQQQQENQQNQQQQQQDEGDQIDNNFLKRSYNVENYFTSSASSNRDVVLIARNSTLNDARKS